MSEQEDRARELYQQMFKPRHDEEALAMLKVLSRSPPEALRALFANVSRKLDPRKVAWPHGMAVKVALGLEESWPKADVDPSKQKAPADGYGCLAAALPDPIAFDRDEFSAVLDLHAGIFDQLNSLIVKKLATFEYENEPFDVIDPFVAMIQLPPDLRPRVSVAGSYLVAPPIRRFFGIMRKYVREPPTPQSMRVIIVAGGMISIRIARIETSPSPHLVWDPKSEVVFEPQNQLMAVLPGRVAVLSITPSNPARLDVLPLPLSLELERKEFNDRLMVLYGPELLERAYGALNKKFASPQDLFLLVTSRFRSGDRLSALDGIAIDPITMDYPRMQQVLHDKRPKGWAPVFITSSLGGAIRWLRYDKGGPDEPPPAPPDEPRPPPQVPPEEKPS
jgi:hypothetical protein